MSLKIVKTFALDFTRNAPLEYIFVKAGDKNSRVLDITPLNSGLVYELPTGVNVVFAAKKPDKTEILNDATVNADTGHIEVTLSEQTLAAEGILLCEVAIYNSDEFLSSQHFYLKASPFALTDVESSNEYNSLVVALLAVDEKVREAEEAIAGAESETPAATLAAIESQKGALNGICPMPSDSPAPAVGSVPTYKGVPGALVQWEVPQSGGGGGGGGGGELSEAQIKQIYQKLYPVGAYYITQSWSDAIGPDDIDWASPAAIIGGSWALIAGGRALFSCTGPDVGASVSPAGTYIDAITSTIWFHEGESADYPLIEGSFEYVVSEDHPLVNGIKAYIWRRIA